MSGVNKVILLGRLTRDPELKHIGDATSLCEFSLATSKTIKNQGEVTTFIECKAWGKTAETINQYCRKGRQLYVEGSIENEEWTDKTSGQNRRKTVIRVERVDFVGDKQEQNSSPRSQSDNSPASDNW